jgi:hypothetical protein
MYIFRFSSINTRKNKSSHQNRKKEQKMATTSFQIGASVSGTTAAGDPFGGIVYSHDESLQLAVLRTPGDIQNSHHVQIVRTKGANVMHSIPPQNGEEKFEEKLPVIDKGRQERRFETAVKAAQFVAGAFCLFVSLYIYISWFRRRSCVRVSLCFEMQSLSLLFPQEVALFSSLSR